MKVLLDYVVRRDESEKGFRQSIISMYEHNAKWSNAVVRLCVHAVSMFLRPRAKSSRYIFWGLKFEELILSLPKAETCIVGGPKQLIFCLKNRRSFLPEMSLWAPLLRGLKNDLCKSNFQALDESLSGLCLKLRRIAGNGAVLIVDNDSLPAQRAFIQAARLANVDQVICIQHGIFQSGSAGHILDGWFADKMFVIDANQKRLLVEKGMPAGKIKVMGYHSSPYLPKRPMSEPGRRKICLVGQPWGKYDDIKLSRYLLIVGKLYATLEAAGCEVYFKPHPWERNSSYLALLSNVVDISMKEALEQYDVFVSLTSTALLEAVASGRIAVQILDPLFQADKFSDFSPVISIDYDGELLASEIHLAIQGESGCDSAQSKPLLQRFNETLLGSFDG